MFRLRSWLFGCVLLIGTFALGTKLEATPPLTTISDTLYNADGTRFNGVAVISWPSFEASDTSNIAAQILNVSIVNGILYVQLVPTTNADSAAVYTVQYTSLGVTQFSQTWAVPPSGTLPFRVRDVALAPGTVSGSAPAAATIITISEVTGLQSALNVRPPMGISFGVSRSAVIDATGAIDAAVGNLTDCLHVDGTSGPCASFSTTFIDGEVPQGTVNGSNTSFTIANVPSPSTSLSVFRNGLLLNPAVDYSLSNNAVTFQSSATPQTGDTLLASYRLSVSIPGVGFVDQQTPTGTVNGSNLTFTLSAAPSPTTSLAVYRNGLRMSPGIDFNLSGQAITFVTGFAPQTGDTLICSYRIVQ
jgi:hypothetical protein